MILRNTGLWLAVTAYFVLVGGAIIIRHARQRDRANFDELRLRCEPIVGSGRVGRWNMSTPLAVILIADDAVFVGGRWRYVPATAAVVHRNDLERMEYRPGPVFNRLLIVRRDGKRLSFSGPDVSNRLRDSGWPVSQGP